MKSYEEALSKKNKYFVEKERYLELLHHCRQYSAWVRDAHDILTTLPSNCEVKIKTGDVVSPVEFKAYKREVLLKKIERIDRLCREACPEASNYLLICITGGYSYDKMEARYEVLPISRKEFYESYRRFFWLLDQELD